jgi:hypothetical protein
VGFMWIGVRGHTNIQPIILLKVSIYSPRTPTHEMDLIPVSRALNHYILCTVLHLQLYFFATILLLLSSQRLICLVL